MTRIEQFVYTAADIDGKRGYQTVARSPGIDDDTLAEMALYMHPAGIVSSEFKESKSLLELDGGRIAYTVARNAGSGYDGRDDTLCSHVLVMHTSDFAKAGYDSRVLDPLCKADKHSRGHLPVIEAKLEAIPAPPITEAVGEVLARCITSLLAGKRTALLSGGSCSIQDVLRLLPESARLVSFSTVVPRPEKQPRYRFIAVPRTVPTGIPEEFEVINQGAGQGREISVDVAYYAQLLLDGRTNAAGDVRSMFDGAAGGSWEDRLGLACDRSRYIAAGPEERRDLAGKILTRAEKIGHRTLLECVQEVAGSLGRIEPQIAHGQQDRSGVDYDGDRGGHWAPILSELSRRGGWLPIRFTDVEKTRIMTKFRVVGGRLCGHLVGGEPDMPIPSYQEFDVSRISDVGVAIGAPSSQSRESHTYYVKVGSVPKDAASLVWATSPGGNTSGRSSRIYDFTAPADRLEAFREHSRDGGDVYLLYAGGKAGGPEGQQIMRAARYVGVDAYVNMWGDPLGATRVDLVRIVCGIDDDAARSLVAHHGRGIMSKLVPKMDEKGNIIGADMAIVGNQT